MDIIDHYCGGYECDNPATIQILAADGGTFGWLCDDCADDLERELNKYATANQKRIEAEVDEDDC